MGLIHMTKTAGAVLNRRSRARRARARTGPSSGRVQDSVTGRFLSADPYITEPGNTQNFNRYSYVNNNPLSYIDPSGFAFECIFSSVGSSIDGVSQGSSFHSDCFETPDRGDFPSHGGGRDGGGGGGRRGGGTPSTTPTPPETPKPPEKPPAQKPKYCSSIGYEIGDFLDSWAGGTIQDVGAGTAIAGGLITLTTAPTVVGAGAGAATVALGGTIYAAGTAVSEVGNFVKWLSGQGADLTAANMLSIPTMGLNSVAQMATQKAVSYFADKAVGNPCK